MLFFRRVRTKKYINAKNRSFSNRIDHNAHIYTLSHYVLFFVITSTFRDEKIRKKFISEIVLFCICNRFGLCVYFNLVGLVGQYFTTIPNNVFIWIIPFGYFFKDETPKNMNKNNKVRNLLLFVAILKTVFEKNFCSVTVSKNMSQNDGSNLP